MPKPSGSSGSWRSAFVISPIGSPGAEDHRHASLVLNYIIKKALDGWDVVRADDEASPDSITAQVIKRIVEADVVIAVLTDRNPNVFYELAVAHGFRKPVVQLMADGQTLPFDVVDQRAIFYDLTNPESVDQATTSVRAAVSWLEENQELARNPLTTFASFESISSAGPEAEGAAVAGLLEAVLDGVAGIERRLGALEEVGGHTGLRRLADGRLVRTPPDSRHSTVASSPEIDELDRRIAGLRMDAKKGDEQALSEVRRLQDLRSGLLAGTSPRLVGRTSVG
jgi:hypothetical protein